MTNSKFEGIQALRAIAAIFVLLMHLTSIEQKYGGGITVLPSVFHYGNIGVDIFFVISGFVMTIITKDLFQTSGEYNFLYKRFVRIFPIYWFYSLLVLGVYLIKPEMVNSSQGGQVNIIKSFLLLPDDNLPLLMVGWSLIFEIYFYIILAIALRTLKRSHYPIFLFSWIIFIILVAWGFSAISDNSLLNIIKNPLCLEFIFGSFIALYYHRVKQAHGSIILGIGAILILSTIVYLENKSIFYVPGDWFNTLLFGTGATLLVLGVVTNEYKLKSIIPKWLTNIGDASYSLYLSHILVISALGRIWSLLTTEHSNIPIHLFFLSLIFLISILWSIVSYKLIELPIINWLNNKTAKYV